MFEHHVVPETLQIETKMKSSISMQHWINIDDEESKSKNQLIIIASDDQALPSEAITKSGTTTAPISDNK